LGPCTAATLHPFAHMGITTMRRMPAHPTATTGRIGSTAACLLAPDRGSTVFTAVAAFGAVAASADEAALSDAAALTPVASQVADLDSPGEAASPVAAASHAARLAEVSTAAVGSTVEVAVVSTAVAEAMVAATGN
jgi:hypothetical protein